MKHYERYWIGLSLLLTLAACQEKSTKTTSQNSNSVDYSTGNSTGGSTTSGTTTGTTTGGTTTSGSTPAQVFTFNVMMAGSFSWYPGFYPGDLDSNVHNGDFYQLSDSNIAVFQSDARYRLRVKALPERFITSTDNNRDVCYNRQQGSQFNAVYGKLKFDVAIRNIYKNGSSYSVGPRYAAKNSGEVSINNYSPTFDWSAGQFPTRDAAGGTLVGHTFEIYNVLSDVYCKSNNSSYCQMSAHVITRCWGMQAELATDSTQNF